MAIRIYDSGRHRVVSLDPKEPGRLSMYACGPTVYNYVHIGNARTSLWYDFMRRYFEYRGLDVTYVANYTDVDDKIIERAKIEKLTPDGIAKKYEGAFEADMSVLGVRPPDVLARATEHIGDMVKTIEGLINNGTAYESDGDVFFSVEKFPAYGKLSGRSLEDLRSSERIEPHPGKRHPVDFALWKSAKEGEPSWPSPWGPGRPGWHIECSVMSTKYLGMGFDLHGGATDLIFPHHENEVAQAEAYFQEEPFVRHWSHAGLVQMESEKMSKSLGNFVLTKDVLEEYRGEVVRYWALSASYRSQVVFSDGALADAEHAYERWRIFHGSASHFLGDEMPVGGRVRRALDDPIDNERIEAFVGALDEDFNSAGAFAVVHDLVRDANKRLESAQHGDDDARKELISLAESFVEMIAVLGFQFETENVQSSIVSGLVGYLLELREDARKERAFDRADGIRSRLHDLGVVVEDTPTGPRWRIGGTFH
jgi:cysteinyl-tRNA synthetase